MKVSTSIKIMEVIFTIGGVVWWQIPAESQEGRDPKAASVISH